MIERDFDIPFIADLALREKQIQQNYRPVIAVHKWFARRPGTLFRGLLLSEFASKPLKDCFYEGNDFHGRRIADPFMGGGTPLLEANRTGCDVLGYDINPMAWWIVNREIEHLDLKKYSDAAATLRNTLEAEIGPLYRTRCTLCGSPDAHAKYFLWVKTRTCAQCHERFDLFPGYLLAEDVRHPKNVFVCPQCGELTEAEDRRHPGECHSCHAPLARGGPAGRNSCKCPHCQSVNTYTDAGNGPPRHRLFAMEYVCPDCRDNHPGRFFKKPDHDDIEHVGNAARRWADMQSRFVPDDEIPGGVETDRLHRWGYRYYREMFNERQLLGLELSAGLIQTIPDERVRNAFATNLSDLLRYQNMLCRYDTMALKSLDIFSVHGFPVGLIQCESNLLGIVDPVKRTCIGSGGWANIIDKYRKAKAYCDHPFEVRHQGGKKQAVPVRNEWIGDRWNGNGKRKQRNVNLICGDAAVSVLPESSLDAVFTDPPYFGNIQYAELMDFCYVWLRRLAGQHHSAFRVRSTRHQDELTGNVNMGRGLIQFTEGISRVYRRMAEALKPGAPLAFTYHHNDLKAYYPIAVAILDSGLTCSASLPCPAEMGASIHIKGTGSSIIDTVFVCRSTGRIPRSWIPQSSEGVAELVRRDIEKLKSGGVRPSSGDTRCIAYGHLTRLAVWHLRTDWKRDDETSVRIEKVAHWLFAFGGWPEVERFLNGETADQPFALTPMIAEHISEYGGVDEISF